CGDDQPSVGEAQADVGTISVELVLAPIDARCVVFTVTPAMGAAVVRQFPIVPEQPVVFNLEGLPLGAVTINERVFTVACPVPGAAMPTWVSENVMVTLTAGVPVDVTFNLT